MQSQDLSLGIVLKVEVFCQPYSETTTRSWPGPTPRSSLCFVAIVYVSLSLCSLGSAGEHPTSELAFDRPCMTREERWEKWGGGERRGGGRRHVGSHLLPPEPSALLPPPPVSPPACLTDRLMLSRSISSSGPLSLSTNSPLLAHRLQILSASLPLDKSQYQWQNIFYVWNVAHNKQSSIRFV